MAAALLMMLVSGLFISSWITLMGSRAQQVSYLEDALKRRLAVESSKSFVWQLAEEKAFDPDSKVNANVQAILGSNAGGLHTSDGWNKLNVYTSAETHGAMTTVFPFNPAGMRPGASFINVEQLQRPTSLTTVDRFNSYLFLKTYPPMLAGDLLTFYKKPDLESTQIDIQNTADQNTYWIVDGRVVIRHPVSFFAKTTPNPLQLSFRSKSLYIQSHDPYGARLMLGTSTAGAKMLPSNAPAIPSTTGPSGLNLASTAKYDSTLDVIRNDRNPDNSLWHFMNREKTAGRSDLAVLDVFTKTAPESGAYWMEEQTNPTYPPPGWPKGYAPRWRVLWIQMNHPQLPHLWINEEVVDQVILKGQTTSTQFANAGAMTPVMIGMMRVGADPLQHIHFEGENNRRLVLGVKSWNRDNLFFHWEKTPIAGPEFRNRCVLINEGHNVFLTMPTNVTQTVRWIGGVMTNWTFKRFDKSTTASRLLFTPDSDSTVTTPTPPGPPFASFIPRDAWLESYFLPVPPSS